MRKFLVFMVIMFMISGLSGAVQDSASFGISLSVPAVYELKVSDSNATNVGQFNSATSISEVEMEYQVAQSGKFYLLVKTNDKTNLKVQAKLEHLKDPTVATMIAYSLKSNGVVLGTSESVGTNYVELLDIPVSVGNGLRIAGKEFIVEMFSDGTGVTPNAFELASVGEYSTTITFELITL